MTAVSQTTLESDNGWSFESSFVWRHPACYDLPRLFLLSLKFMCLVFGGIYGNSFWSFTSYRIMLPLCVQAKSEPFRIRKTAQMHWAFCSPIFVSQILVLRGLCDSCLKQKKARGQRASHTIMSPSHQHVSALYSDSEAPWQAPAVTVITEAMLSVLC